MRIAKPVTGTFPNTVTHHRSPVPDRGGTPMTRPWRPLVISVVVALVVAACGSDEAEEITTTTAVEETTTTAAETTTTTAAETTTTTVAEVADSIADILAADENLSTLLAAVEAAGLTEALADPDASLTVFAPTNEAFEAALADLGLTAEDLLADTETLISILTYHVLGEVVTTADLIRRASPTPNMWKELPVETLNGAELVIRVTEEGVRFAGQGQTTVTQADVGASNGVIHVIDGVLLPPQA